MKTAGIFIKKVLIGIWSKTAHVCKVTKKFLWDHRQGIEMVILFLTLVVSLIVIWISHLALRDSQKFGSTMIAQLDTLSTLFTKVNEQISYLPTSVSKFDSTVQGLNEGISNQQQEFQKSISGLQRNIDGFSKGIADYGRVLAKIVEASDKQLALLDERQKLLEKELMSKPELILRVKKCQKDTLDLGRLTIRLEIVNIGDAIAEYCRILIMVPAEFEFSSSGFNVYDLGEKIQVWSYNFLEFIGFSSEKQKYPVVSTPRMEFSIKILPSVKFPYKLEYILHHNKGDNKGELVINLPK